MTEAEATTGPTSIQWLFILLGLGALAIAQPLFTVFGDAPELFVFYGADTADLWILAALAVFLVPVAIWAVGWLVGRIDGRAGALVHRAGATILTAALGVQIARTLGAERSLVLTVAGVGAGALAWFALSRVRPVREWAMVLAPAGLVFAGLFLFTSSPARAIAGASESTEPIEPAAVADDLAPLAILIVDELPTRSVVTDDRQLDAAVMPNLAAFAEDATWYRNHTTVAEQTTQAVPALFSGQYTETADQQALWFDHPDNIFRLLESTHALQVSEALTQVCPPDLCSLTPDSVAGDESDDASTEDAPPAAWRRLWTDAREVVSQRVWPWTEPETIGLDRFADLDGGFPTFEAQGAVEMLDPVARFFGFVGAAQPGRFGDFLQAMEPGDSERPSAHIFHLVLPHQPWLFRGDGTQREAEVDPSYLGYEGGRVLDEPFALSVGRSHHLQQAQYADGLIGSFLGRLDELGIYDDAAIVIVADHGISFKPETPQRAVGDGNDAEILPTPLLVKLPGQSEGTVSDAQVELVDVLPLVTESVGVSIPWETDGVPIGERSGPTHYLDEDEGMTSVDHQQLMADLAAAITIDQRPETVLADAGLTPDQAVVVPDGEPIEVEAPLDDNILAMAPDGVVALGLFDGDDLVAVGMAASSGKVVVPVPEGYWGASSADLRLVPVQPGSGD